MASTQRAGGASQSLAQDNCRLPVCLAITQILIHELLYTMQMGIEADALPQPPTRMFPILHLSYKFFPVMGRINGI